MQADPEERLVKVSFLKLSISIKRPLDLPSECLVHFSLSLEVPPDSVSHPLSSSPQAWLSSMQASR